MTEANKQIIKKLWNLGETIEMIIRLVPMKQTHCRALIKQMRESGELPPRGRARGKTDREVISAYESGITNKYDLAQMFDLTTAHILYILRHNGYGGRPEHNHKTRRKNTPDELSERTQAIALAIQSGVKTGEICRQYGVTRQYVNLVKKKYLTNKTDNE